MTTQSMTFRTAREGLLTANQRLVWQAKHRRTSELRTIVATYAGAYLKPVTERVRVEVEYRFPGPRRHRDAENLAPSSKVFVDAMRVAGVLQGDDTRYVVGVDNRIGDKATGDLVEVTITLEAA